MTAHNYGRFYNVPSFGLRFFNVYGPGQDPHSPYSGVISIFLERLIKNQPLTFYGDGLQSRDFVHVNDVVRILYAAMKEANASAPVVNVCTGHATSLRELASLLGEITGLTPEIHQENPRLGDIPHSRGDASLLMEILGIRPEISLSEGLEQLYECEREKT
jgi:UDP-glucose 4-epimerase